MCEKSYSSVCMKTIYGNGHLAGLKKASTFSNCTVEKSRGFKPSDRKDPSKRQFLIELSKQIWQKANDTSSVTKKVDLQKIFTPATDAVEILPKNRKLYASSAFYAPGLHPTVEDQVELARRISHSLSDISNQTSKGQSMYVNRKKRSVKWVHEGQGQDYRQPSPRPLASPSLLPAYSEAGKHRVQLNMHQEQLLEKYAKPGLKAVKTPWEAALETGSASAAFVEDTKPQSSLYQTPMSTLPASPAPQYIDSQQSFSSSYNNSTEQTYGSYQSSALPSSQPTQSSYGSSGGARSDPTRDLAYKPNLAQGWKGPNISISKDLYLPKDIPLESYAPPPKVDIRPSPYRDNWQTKSSYESSYSTQTYPQSSNLDRIIETSSSTSYNYKPAEVPSSNSYNYKPADAPSSNSYHYKSADREIFPASNASPMYPERQNFPMTTGVPPKQQYWAPTSYQKVRTQNNQQPGVNFNPSPLPYDKLAKFENPEPETNYQSYHNDMLRRKQSPRFAPRSAASVSPLCPSVSPYPVSNTSDFGGNSAGFSSKPHFPSQQNGNLSPSPYSPTSFNKNALLHGPTFNTAARGWSSGNKSFSSSGSHFKQPVQLTTGFQDMPYTDF